MATSAILDQFHLITNLKLVSFNLQNKKETVTFMLSRGFLQMSIVQPLSGACEQVCTCAGMDGRTIQRTKKTLTSLRAV